MSLACPRIEFFDNNNKCTGVFKGDTLSFTALLKQNNGKVFAYEMYGFTDDVTTFHHLRDVISQNYNLCDFDARIENKGNVRQLTKLKLILNSMKPKTRTPDQPVTIEDTWTDFLTLSNRPSLNAESDPGPYVKGTEDSFSPSDKLGASKFLNFDLPRLTLRQFRGTETTLSAIYKSILAYTPFNIKISEVEEIPGPYYLEFMKVHPLVAKDSQLQENLGLSNICLKAFRQIASYTYAGNAEIWRGLKLN